MTLVLTDVTEADRVGTRPAWLTSAVFPFQSRFLELDAVRIHYVDEGQGPILLFLHPAPASSFLFREFICRLRSRFRCIALDYPGFGLSEGKSGFGFTLPEYAAVVRDFVQTLDLTDIILFVHDSGGPIGLGAARQAPNRYKALILTDTFAFPLTAYPFMRGMLRCVTSRPFRFLNRRFNLMPRIVATLAPVRRRLSREERAVYRQLFPTLKSRDRILDLMSQLLTQQQYLQQVEEGIQQHLHDLPVLLMYGQFDPARLAGWPRRFEELFPHHRTRIIPGEGHFPHEGSPARMIAEILDWYDAFESS